MHSRQRQAGRCAISPAGLPRAGDGGGFCRHSTAHAAAGPDPGQHSPARCTAARVLSSRLACSGPAGCSGPPISEGLLSASDRVGLHCFTPHFMQNLHDVGWMSLAATGCMIFAGDYLPIGLHMQPCRLARREQGSRAKYDWLTALQVDCRLLEMSSATNLSRT